MSRYDTKHVQDLKDLSQAKALAGQYYVRARKAEDKRDEVIRANITLCEKIIALEAKLARIEEIIDASV